MKTLKKVVNYLRTEPSHEFWYFVFIFFIALLAYLVSYADAYNYK